MLMSALKAIVNKLFLKSCKPILFKMSLGYSLTFPNFK